MNTSPIRRLETAPREDLLAMMEGRVFHVTPLSNLARILTEGAIRSNRDQVLPSGFGGGMGYFREMNCVSLFDYRQMPPDDPMPYRSRCHPFQPLEPQRGLALLFLAPTEYPRLIPWTGWKERQLYSLRVVPYVEVGYPGDLPITKIPEALCIEVDEDPDSIQAIFRGRRGQVRTSTDETYPSP